MNRDLLTLREQVAETLGDLEGIDFDTANLTRAVNWAIIEAARLTGKTATIRSKTINAGESLVDASPCIGILNVTAVP